MNRVDVERGGESEGTPQRIRVLMYHRVVQDKEECRRHWTSVSAEEFRKQLMFLDRRGFTPITFDELNLIKEGKLNLPRKPVILTFDDGYRDTFSIAAPIMREFKMRGVVFVLGDRTITTNKWDGARGIGNAPLMNAEEILALSRSGFEIGAHSMTHPRLPDLSSHEAWIEISRSKMLLEILLDFPIKTFSYPYGLVNQPIQNMVNDAGYSYACSVYTGPAAFGVAPLEIRRITIANNTTLAGFAARLLLPYTRYQWLRSRASSSLSSLKRLVRYESLFDEQTPAPTPSKYRFPL